MNNHKDNSTEINTISPEKETLAKNIIMKLIKSQNKKIN